MGTLNLCLEMPDTEQMTRSQSDQHGRRKRPKTAKKLQELENCYFSSVFWGFLSPGWSEWVLVFCSVSGILRHKFRVPTKGTLKTKVFWPINGFWLSSEARSQTKMDKNYFFLRPGTPYLCINTFWDIVFFSDHTSFDALESRNYCPFLVADEHLHKAFIAAVRVWFAAVLFSRHGELSIE